MYPFLYNKHQLLSLFSFISTLTSKYEISLSENDHVYLIFWWNEFTYSNDLIRVFLPSNQMKKNSSRNLHQNHQNFCNVTLIKGQGPGTLVNKVFKVKRFYFIFIYVLSSSLFCFLYVYIYIYIYICVCVCVCAAKVSSRNCRSRGINSPQYRVY